MSHQFSEAERAVLRIVQADLPDTLAPYADIAREAGVSEAEVLELLARLKASGAIRRFGASIKHQKTGWTHNAHGGLEGERGGSGRMRAHRLASRPYLPRLLPSCSVPDWPYTLYTMVHGRSEEECLKVVDELLHTSPLREYAILRSLRELKKYP